MTFFEQWHDRFEEVLGEVRGQAGGVEQASRASDGRHLEAFGVEDSFYDLCFGDKSYVAVSY